MSVNRVNSYEIFRDLNFSVKLNPSLARRHFNCRIVHPNCSITESSLGNWDNFGWHAESMISAAVNVTFELFDHFVKFPTFSGIELRCSSVNLFSTNLY